MIIRMVLNETLTLTMLTPVLGLTPSPGTVKSGVLQVLQQALVDSNPRTEVLI